MDDERLAEVRERAVGEVPYALDVIAEAYTRDVFELLEALEVERKRLEAAKRAMNKIANTNLDDVPQEIAREWLEGGEG